MSRSILFAASLSMLAASIHACDGCSVGNPAGLHDDHNGWSAGLSEKYTHFGTLLDGGDEVDNEFDQRLDSSVTQVSIGYDRDRWGIQINVPYIHRNFKRTEGFETEHGTEMGIGDVSALGSWTVYRHEHDRHHAHVALLAGVEFPTGDSDRLGEEHEDDVPGAPESAVHSHDLALGSGSWDGIVGVTGFHSRECWFASAMAQYAIRTEGDHDYRYANELSWRVSPGYLVWQAEEDSLGVQLSFSGEHKGKDEHDGEKEDETGMTSVYLGPACALSLGRFSADAGVDVPIYQDTSAVHIVPDWRAHASVVARF